jgi:sialidase-1
MTAIDKRIGEGLIMPLLRPAMLCLMLIFAASLSHAQERKSVKLENTENVIVFKEGVYACFPFLPKVQPKDGIYMAISTRIVSSHNDPTGGTVLMRSTDDCRTWQVFQKYEKCFITEETNEIQAMKTPEDTLLSLHAGWEYYPEAKRAELKAAGWDMMDAREGLIGALSAHSVRISRNDGKSWKTRELPLPNAPGVMSFHGGIVTDQGIALWPVYGLAMSGDSGHSYVYRSADSGKTWTFHEIIADSHGKIPMNETSLLDLGGGHILAFVRTGDDVDHMFRAESVNGGVTWGRLADSGITGHPPDLLKLQNGHILLTYGYRHKPYGVRAVISKDNAQTWGEEFILRDDGYTGDLGYPMSIQLEDGTIFTTDYFRIAGSPTHIAGTRWHEPE